MCRAMKDNFPGFVSQGCFSLDPGDVSERVASKHYCLNVFMGKRMLLLDNKSVIVESRSADIT